MYIVGARIVRQRFSTAIVESVAARFCAMPTELILRQAPRLQL